MIRSVRSAWFELLVVIVLTVASASSALAQAKPHHARAGLNCAMCHGAGDTRRYQPVDTKTCVTCHERTVLIRKTERVNKTVREKNPVSGLVETVVKDLNPHSGHHDRGRLDCFECHREHKPSKNLCAQCHDVERWMRPIP
jgi:hypothetical protein